jgi:phospholipase C
MKAIRHFIVLVMENRSFDHMLGYLDHPDPSFDGAGRIAGTPTTPNARYSIYPGPGHSHRDVMHQILGQENPPAFPNDHYNVTMGGFEANYEKRAPGRGHKALRCFDPRMVPVLSTLALEFAVCDRWFCSVPGETWPNRDFLHAGTSFGEVDVKRRLIASNPATIFHAMDLTGHSWRLYHQGIAHTLIYPQLYLFKNRLRSHQSLLDDIANDELPSYAFVEPDYGLVEGVGNSQHPSQARSREEFVDGEALIASIYEALRQKPDVFEKTAFVITYDEHGGFYDHVPPPRAFQPDTSVYKSGTYAFGFRVYGPRVPTVIVSPWIPRHTVDHTEYDHCAIAETVRRHLAFADVIPLSDRATATFSPVFSLPEPRRDDEVPALNPLSHADALALEEELAAPPDETDLSPALDFELQNNFRWLLNKIGL